MRTDNRRAFGVACALFVLALAARVAWLHAVGSPFDNVWSDMRGYFERADDLAHGHADHAPVFATFYPPGTHYVLAAEMLLVDVKHELAFAALHAIWGALVAPCVFLLARRAGHPGWLAALVGAVTAVWYPLLAFTGFFSSETIFAGLLALSALFMVRWFDRGDRAVAVGLTIALGYLVRPQILLTLVLLAAWGLATYATGKLRISRARVRSLVTVTTLLAITMWFGAARYAALTGRSGLISDNGAMMRLFADTDYGVVRSSEGNYFEPPSKLQTNERRELFVTGYVGNGRPLEKARRAELARTPWRARASRFGWNVSLLFARNDLWPEWTQSEPGTPRRKLLDATTHAMAWLALPLALVGVASTLRRPRAPLVVATAHVGTTLVVAGLFYGEMRYRVPYDAFFLFLAAEGALATARAVAALVRRAVRDASIPSRPALARRSEG